ncbi:ead/Ea22-like family protein [Enterobacter cancerogenus]
MSNIDKQAYRADGGDIGTGRIREIADNPYGDEEKCWLAKRLLALLDELEAADKKTVEMPTFDGYVPHIARELQAAFRIACDNAGINVAAGTDGKI